MADRPNIDRMMKTLSEILSNKYGCKVTITATPKDKSAEETTQKAS